MDRCCHPKNLENALSFLNVFPVYPFGEPKSERDLVVDNEIVPAAGNGIPVVVLVAELGAAFLCADLELAIEPREKNASYIANWLDVLKNDTRFIFKAAAHAQPRRITCVPSVELTTKPVSWLPA